MKYALVEIGRNTHTHTHTMKKPFQLPHKLAKTARHCNTSISFCGITCQCVVSGPAAFYSEERKNAAGPETNQCVAFIHR